MEQPLTRTLPRFFLNTMESLARRTESEEILWSYLIQKPLGFEFSQQHPVHHLLADFFCTELQLVIEIKSGNHEKPELNEKDKRKDEWLRENGFSILRFTNFEIERGFERVILTIENKIQLIGSASRGRRVPP